MSANLIMSIPSVLMNGVTNESQDLTINTEVLEPNSLNAVQAVFVLPKKGSVLDSKSALKFRIDWSGYAEGTATDVGGKLFSGVLGAIKNARLYASGQLISDLRHAGEKIHLDNQWKSQEFREEYCDIKHNSASGFAIAEDIAQSGLNGAICSTDRFDTRTAGSKAVCHDKPYFRGIGTAAAKNGLESFLLLEELFPMLKDIQLPLRFLKDEIRIEIDWEQDKKKWLYVGGAAVADGLASVTISEAVLFLDYITYSPEVDASLEATLATVGGLYPFPSDCCHYKDVACRYWSRYCTFRRHFDGSRRACRYEGLCSKEIFLNSHGYDWWCWRIDRKPRLYVAG